MNKKENEQEFVIREKGPVWNVKVGIYSYFADGFRIRNIQEKRWKVKEILN
jgi:Tfp pilus assembly protein PilP